MIFKVYEYKVIKSILHVIIQIYSQT